MTNRLLITAAVTIFICVSARPLSAQWTGVASGIYYNGGNVGIGTTSPEFNLSLMGSGLNVALELNNTGSAGQDWLLATQSGSGSLVGKIFFYNNSNGATPLVITPSGNVGIGTVDPANTLSVNGAVQAKEVLVNTGWSDYVFAPGYPLLGLKDTAAYIQTNGHLPGIPSETEVKEKGVPVGEMESKLLAKVEELTLHMIQADERNDRLEQRNRELQERLALLESRLAPAQDK